MRATNPANKIRLLRKVGSVLSLTSRLSKLVQVGNRVAGAIVISLTDAANQEAVVDSAQRVVVARARAPRGAAVQHCLECLGSEHPYFELEGSARSVAQFEGVFPEAAPCIAFI